MRKIPPTPRGKATFEFIKKFVEENDGVSPALRDIAEEFQITPQAANCRVVELEARGWITRTPGKRRSIELAPDPRKEVAA